MCGHAVVAQGCGAWLLRLSPGTWNLATPWLRACAPAFFRRCAASTLHSPACSNCLRRSTAPGLTNHLAYAPTPAPSTAPLCLATGRLNVMEAGRGQGGEAEVRRQRGHQHPGVTGTPRALSSSTSTSAVHGAMCDCLRPRGPKEQSEPACGRGRSALPPLSSSCLPAQTCSLRPWPL